MMMMMMMMATGESTLTSWRGKGFVLLDAVIPGLGFILSASPLSDSGTRGASRFSFSSFAREYLQYRPHRYLNPFFPI